jgi:hypothetical protein
MLDLYAFGDIFLQAGLRLSDLIGHIERMTQSSKLISAFEGTARRKISPCG